MESEERGLAKDNERRHCISQSMSEGERMMLM